MAPLLGTDNNWNGGAACSSHKPEKPLPHSKSILYVDAYDSFSYNVVALLEETLDVKVTVKTIHST